MERTGKKISVKTLKRIIKKLRWCRGRKFLKSKRNENEFREAQKKIEILKDEDKENIIDLYYFDESGFTDCLRFHMPGKMRMSTCSR